MPRNEVMRNLLIQSVLGKGVASAPKPIANKTRRRRCGRGRMARICLDSSIYRGETPIPCCNGHGGLTDIVFGEGTVFIREQLKKAGKRAAGTTYGSVL